ncbi:MAG: hypothetical protein COB67_07785 [SAR324 cluster bacterium]|uniref:MotA/TolQ/ExbB proton channel domain-containing protein n=1 Tax=SAR324 cluster bacterium TaxID=2024889 RepID=A0A2A4T2Q0_9DELT|nr:MAG: hypothetical protein COB67_07785 [SAR324 cluster bacterium]
MDIQVLTNWLRLPSNSFLATSLQGGVVEHTALGILLLMSLVSWGIIFKKMIFFQLVMRTSRNFLKQVDLYQGLTDLQIRADVAREAYPAQEFHAAYREYQSTIEERHSALNTGEKKALILRIERCIERSIVTHNSQMEKGISLLATISGSAPFIGLFGTVVGIIDAFQNISTQGSSSIAVVAPGISSALVATGFGLFTAIPALIAFNLFREKNRVISNEMRSFGLELINLFDREAACYNQIKTVSNPSVKLT